MPEYFAVLTLLLFVGMVLARVFFLRGEGIRVVYFANLDKNDFVIPPFILFYFYVVFANAFNWPTISTEGFFHSEIIQWIGVFLCLAGLLLVWWSLVSFGNSFRVGIDTEHPDKLITSGAFAYSRNPIYVAFAFILLGQFLILSSWLLLVYLVAGVWLFHRQVLREEDYLKKHYGKEYLEYSNRVRRYI